MTRTYTHELNQEVQTISGWYELHKEERIELGGEEILYVVCLLYTSPSPRD